MDGERRSALLVATADYGDEQLRRLRAPVHDAQRLSEVLADPSIGAFTVTPLTDRPSYEVREQIEGFFAERSPDELLLLYFSCHGVTDVDGRLYFATTDTRRQRLRATAVEAAFVQDCFHACRSRRIVLILDCCHSGAFPAGMASKSAGTVPIQAQLEGRGRAVLTSSDALEYAFEVNGDRIEGTGVGSAFTTALVDGLRSGEADIDGDGVISVGELYDFAYNRVREVQPSQTPRAWIDVQGQLVIARSVRPPSPETLPTELRELMGNPFANARVAAVKELAGLLASSRRGIAGAAEAALRQLGEDDSLSVRQAAQAALELHAGGVSPANVGAPPEHAAPAAIAPPPRRSLLTIVAHAVMAAAFLAALLALQQSVVYEGGPSGWDLATSGFGSQAAVKVYADFAMVAVISGLILSLLSVVLAGRSGRVQRVGPPLLLALAACATAALLVLPPALDSYQAMEIPYWIAVVGALAALSASSLDMVRFLKAKRPGGVAPPGLS